MRWRAKERERVGCQRRNERFVLRLHGCHTPLDSAPSSGSCLPHGTKPGRNTNHAQIKPTLGTAFWADGSSTVDPRPSSLGLRHPCCVHCTPVVAQLPGHADLPDVGKR